MAPDEGAGAPIEPQAVRLDPDLALRAELAPINQVDTAFVLRTLQRVVAERDLLLALARSMGYTEEAIAAQLRAAWPLRDADSQVTCSAGRNLAQVNNGEPTA